MSATISHTLHDGLRRHAVSTQRTHCIFNRLLVSETEACLVVEHLFGETICRAHGFAI